VRGQRRPDQRPGRLRQLILPIHQALIAYKKSIIAPQQSMYTLVEANDFELQKAKAKAAASR
jgi:hypothetical protein